MLPAQPLGNNTCCCCCCLCYVLLLLLEVLLLLLLLPLLLLLLLLMLFNAPLKRDAVSSPDDRRAVPKLALLVPCFVRRAQATAVHRVRKVVQDVVTSDRLAPPSAPLGAGAHTARGRPTIGKQPELGKSDKLRELVKNQPHARAH